MKVKAIFTQLGFCVLTYIHSKECTLTTDFPPGLDSGPSTNGEGYGTSRDDGPTVNTLFWLYWNKQPPPAPRPQAAAHTGSGAALLSFGLLWLCVMQEYFQTQLFILNYGVKSLVITEGLVYAFKCVIGQLLSSISHCWAQILRGDNEPFISLLNDFFSHPRKGQWRRQAGPLKETSWV